MSVEIQVDCLVRETSAIGEALTALGWGTLWIEEPFVQVTNDEGFELHGPAPDVRATVHAWPTDPEKSLPVVPTAVCGRPVLVVAPSDSAPVDWNEAWRAEHPERVEIVPGWVVVPPWGAPRADETALVIEPGGAFGTGGHPTTQHSLAVLFQVLTPNARVLDLGSGSGILAIAAVAWGAGVVRAVDLDPSAPTQVLANMALNGIQPGRIEVVLEDLVAALRSGETWDVVLCNVGAAEVSRALDAAVSAVSSGGVFVASGVFSPSRERVERAAPKDFRELAVLEKDNWVTLAWRREVM